MKTVQLTLEEKLIFEVDKAVKSLHTTRSAFTRIALQEKLAHLKLKEKELQHRQGYKRKPVKPGEFDERN